MIVAKASAVALALCFVYAFVFTDAHHWLTATSSEVDLQEYEMKYTRIYADEAGESHFEDVEIEFSSVDFAPPAPPLDVSKFNPATQYGFLKADTGWFGDWHPAPRRQIMLYLSGEIEAEVSDGEIRRFGPGSITLVEDTTGKGHRSRVVGETEAFGVVIQLQD